MHMHIYIYIYIYMRVHSMAVPHVPSANSALYKDPHAKTILHFDYAAIQPSLSKS